MKIYLYKIYSERGERKITPKSQKDGYITIE